MERAKIVRKIKVVASHPSEIKYKDMNINKIFSEYPVTVEKISRMKKSIIRLNLSVEICKTIKYNSIRVNTEEYVAMMIYLY